MERKTEILTGQQACESLDKDGGKYKLALVHNLVGGFGDRIRERMKERTGNRHYEAYEFDWMKECETVENDVDSMKAQGDTFVVTENGKPVGMASIKNIGNDPTNGHEIWEIMRVSVLEDAEGRSYATKLVKVAVEEIRKRNASADILVATSNDAIVRLCERLGFPRISLEHFCQIKYQTLDLSAYHEQIEHARPYAKDYLLPPEKLLAE